MSTAAARSVDRTASANSTVTCLYFAASPETFGGGTALVTIFGVLAQSDAACLTRHTRLSSPSHRLGPGNMSLEVKRFRHGAVAVPKMYVSRGIAVCSGK